MNIYKYCPPRLYKPNRHFDLSKKIPRVYKL